MSTAMNETDAPTAEATTDVPNAGTPAATTAAPTVETEEAATETATTAVPTSAVSSDVPSEFVDIGGGGGGGAGAAGTAGPTPEPNPCQSVRPGDIQLILENSEAPDQMAWFTLDNVPAGVGRIYATDRPWNGTHLLDNGEGTVYFDVPNVTTRERDGVSCVGFCPGYTFGYGFDKDQVNWTVDDPTLNRPGDTFDLGIGGDTILTYCLASDGVTPHFIHGFSFANRSWAEPGLNSSEYGTERSALPESLAVNGSVAVPYYQNYIFNATIEASRDDIRYDDLIVLYREPSNYQGSNEMRFSIAALLDDESSAACTARARAFAGIAACTWVAMLLARCLIG